MFGREEAEARLRAAVEEVEGRNLALLSDGDLERDFSEVHRAVERLEAERLRRLAALDERRSLAREGHLSAATWVAERFGVDRARAAGDLKAAQALGEMPATRDAFASERVPLSALRILIAARSAEPEAFTASEDELVSVAAQGSITELKRSVGAWRSARLDERMANGEGEDPRWNLRELHLFPAMLGMVRIVGNLDPVTGETVLTALRSVVDAEARTADPQDVRSFAQRRADALGEVCRSWLDEVERPMLGGERPHLNLTVDVMALTGKAERSAELDHTGPVGREVARLLACDASVSRVVIAGRSEPLDVGRRTPVVPAAIRRAVMIRDRSCRFPGCGRPGSWCDAHHVVHWTDGGPTALGNLVLLCRRHHRLIHQRRFRVEIADGWPVFRKRDGSVLADRGPPLSVAGVA